MKTAFKWLQISDLHVFESTDLNIMMKAYEKLAGVVKPDFIIATGDYRHKQKKTDYNNALVFLNRISQLFGVKKENIFLVPGNHDVNDYKHRSEILASINAQIEKDADCYREYMKNDEDDLRNAFWEYSQFISSFYEGSINLSDKRIKSSSDVVHLIWKKKLNIIMLNTALVSNGKEVDKLIIDIEKLSSLSIKNNYPTIVIAHHSIENLADSHKERLVPLLEDLNVKAYFCGDEHKLRKGGVNKIEIPNTTIPIMVCGKSVVETGDDYSDICAIEYSCELDGNAYVQVYRYNTAQGFIQYPDFYYSINKQFFFSMFKGKQNLSVVDEKPKKKEKKKTNKRNPLSIWLPDAELAEGKQTRFNSFTETEEIKTFLSPNSSSLGIVSVKGIGKTFLLQVKRIKSSKRFFCLPNVSNPSASNNWATERVSFDKYKRLKTENIYDDLVLLWKVSIKCYVINCISETGEHNVIEERYKSGKINDIFFDLCVSPHNQKLELIIKAIISNNHWEDMISEYETEITRLYHICLCNRNKRDPDAKEIAIFIDKVDQAIKQTNAEPPADCVVCPKNKNVLECNSRQKGDQYCTSESGCQSKNCCYGCEIFASPTSNEGLRIYEKSNAAKLIHINIWQYLQIALMSAATQLCDESAGQVHVFYTIRQEAFDCEKDLLGEQNQKIAGKTFELKYTKEEQEKIFLDCIKNQDEHFLFSPNSLKDSGMEEYAFVGVRALCHPYCKDAMGHSKKESVFESIYRHSFDRSRDIQRYGEALTKKMDKIRACETEHEREELVKEIIEDMAADIAYCSRKSESTVNPSYYTEKMHFLPNFWANNDNFEKLLKQIDRNLLFEDDIRTICKRINGHDRCPSLDCQSCDCKRHPFSMLYNMGYLGYILPNHNNSSDELQQFIDSKSISYFPESDDLISLKRTLFIIHPALTKTIEKKYNKNFKHFCGFILGRELRADRKTIEQMIKDRKDLSAEKFQEKYYYSPLK